MTKHAPGEPRGRPVQSTCLLGLGLVLTAGYSCSAPGSKRAVDVLSTLCPCPVAYKNKTSDQKVGVSSTKGLLEGYPKGQQS